MIKEVTTTGAAIVSNYLAAVGNFVFMRGLFLSCSGFCPSRLLRRWDFLTSRRAHVLCLCRVPEFEFTPRSALMAESRRSRSASSCFTMSFRFMRGIVARENQAHRFVALTAYQQKSRGLLPGFPSCALQNGFDPSGSKLR